MIGLIHFQQSFMYAAMRNDCQTPGPSPWLLFVDQLDRDVVGKVSLSTGKPIVPKLVRGQAASDMLIKPSASSAGVAVLSSNIAGYFKTAAGSLGEAKQGNAWMT